MSLTADAELYGRLRFLFLVMISTTAESLPVTASASNEMNFTWDLDVVLGTVGGLIVKKI